MTIKYYPVDLHIHSVASDGKLSVSTLVDEAGQRGMKVIAITDHDTVAGIPAALERAKKYPALTVIPGVEINTDVPGDEVHIMGYYMDYQNQELENSLIRMRSSRQDRAKKMVNLLSNLGLPVDWELVQKIAGKGSIGRPHIAQAMLEKGYVLSIKEAFEKYIGRQGPAYADRDKMLPEEAVRLIRKAGGLAVLAHPGTLKNREEMLSRLILAGLVGLEAYYSNYTEETKKKLVNLAKNFGLIATGGSDFHGLDSANETPMGGVYVPLEAVTKLSLKARELLVKG